MFRSKSPEQLPAVDMERAQRDFELLRLTAIESFTDEEAELYDALQAQVGNASSSEDTQFTPSVEA